MDTKAVAVAIGTEARVLRRFLRDPKSSFCTVGSGARYDFSDEQVEEIRERFCAWQKGKAPTHRGPRIAPEVKQRTQDQAVWAEEKESRARRGLNGIVLEDMRDPRVRARVRATAAAQEARLNERLLAAGLHITQMARRAS